MTLRVGFLFDYRSDQVWHALPIACELSRQRPDVDVVCLTGNRVVHRMAIDIARSYPDHRCRIRRGRVPFWARLANPLLRNRTPLEKKGVLRTNRSFFRSLDALVAPDVTSIKLRHYHSLPKLPMILTRHGAGDRAGSFPETVSQFDLVLAPGLKTQRELTQRGLVTPSRCPRIGYPKFAAVDRLPEPTRVFNNDNPVILYNPHFDPELSSWYEWGIQVLDFFQNNADRYNLIFAPHIKLFGLRGRYKVRLPRRYRRLPNIHVDLGSRKSVDMTYTRVADLYLGDVSSQVYEFLRSPRPCVFLNATGVEWRHDEHFRHWHLGQVLDQVEQLGPVIEEGLNDLDKHRAAQAEALSETFDDNGDGAMRGAEAIYRFLQHGE